VLLQWCDGFVSGFCFCVGYNSCSTTPNDGSVTHMRSTGAPHVKMHVTSVSERRITSQSTGY